MKRQRPEAAFQATVIEMATLFGWLVAHFRPGRTAGGGWRTPIQGHAGYPDLTLTHGGWRRFLVAELKSERGALTPEQRLWIETLKAAGVEAYCWRPSDWNTIEKVLGVKR